MATRGWEGEGEIAARRERQRADDEEPVADGQADDAQTATAKPTPTKRKRNVLAESHLLSAEGFKKIHRTFPYQVSGGVAAGQEAKALSSLVKMYKQWAYDLYPGLNFEDFIDRTETLGKSTGVQGLMSDLRTKEMRRAHGLPEEPATRADDDDDNRSRNGEDDDDVPAPDPEESGFATRNDDDDDSEEEFML
ncbi:hypothetical protein Poli38472_013411 [Pythium oligandrum]|uniref:Chromosome segregation in meiosis protein 3 domain-containing protein n=1 Tax=Pythium oligandrum TaxID=41045 RepID=A0A8K1C7G0_PYTOL|nr:hypothetical protein Poli38472_013411 [Pythium oligandrum]|eukprot:TMW57937.1 hypothetical protein Poli38472_013411 [Pythium oligandrum]